MGTDVSLGASLLTSGGVLVSGFMIRKRVSDQVPCKADFAGIYMYWRVQNDLSSCMRFVILNEMGVMVMELCIGFEKRNGRGGSEREGEWNRDFLYEKKGISCADDGGG